MKLRNWWRSRKTGPITVLLCLVSATSDAGQQRAVERNSAATPRAEPSASDVEAQRATANARFLLGDEHGALDALNSVGEPRISEVKIEGLVRAKRTTVADYLGIASGDVLTSERLSRAARRMADLPVASKATVRYDLGDDSVVLRPILFERNRFYATPADWVPVGVRAAFTQEVRLTLSDATGHGDVWTPSFRWASGRPRVALETAAPAPSWLPGTIHFDTSWQRYRYLDRSSGAGTVIEEDRTRAGVALSDWLTSWLQWKGGAAVDHIASTTYVALNANLNARSFNDHVATMVGGTWYRAETQRFATGDFAVAMRSTTYDDRPLVTGLVGFAVAGDSAPLALWPAASSGTDQTSQLRAHRLFDSGIVTSETFGRQLLFASTEYVHPLPTRLGPGFMGLAGFVDAAQARSRLEAAASPLHVDVGVGLRVNTSRSGSRVRIDFGYGLRDGHTRVSAGYVQPWGKR